MKKRPPNAAPHGAFQDSHHLLKDLFRQRYLTAALVTAKTDKQTFRIKGRPVVQGQNLPQPGPGMADKLKNQPHPLSCQHAVRTLGRLLPLGERLLKGLQLHRLQAGHVLRHAKELTRASLVAGLHEIHSSPSAVTCFKVCVTRLPATPTNLKRSLPKKQDH